MTARMAGVENIVSPIAVVVISKIRLDRSIAEDSKWRTSLFLRTIFMMANKDISTA
ncbi:MAG: hypothetical protein ABSF48_21210 [Thermodesulfobacteriota bacterium]